MHGPVWVRYCSYCLSVHQCCSLCLLHFGLSASISQSRPAEDLQAGRPGHWNIHELRHSLRVAAPRHGRATRGRLRHTGARFDPSDDGCLRAPAGTITDACGRSDAPGSVDRRVARLRPIGYKTGHKPSHGRRRQHAELGFGGPPGSRIRRLGIKRAGPIVRSEQLRPFGQVGPPAKSPLFNGIARNP